MQSSAMGTCFLHSPSRNAGPRRTRRVLIFPSASAVPFRKWNNGDSVELSAAGVAHTCLIGRLMTRRRQLLVHSVDKESQPTYELDQEKALQALNELDQQLDSVLKKPVPQPKIRASNLPDTMRNQMKGEEPVFTGPALAYGAFALFVFTILYNIIFYAVIKPSIDIS